MPNFKLSSRSSHGLFSTKRSNDARPTHTNTSRAKRGNIGEAVPDDSVMTSNVDAEHIDGNGEPFVVDFATMHDTSTKQQRPPLTPPPNSKPSLSRDGTWLSDDENTAPPPPDFVRRDIHVPTRTSSSTPSANKKRLSLQRRISSDTTVHKTSASPEPQPRSRSVSQTPQSGTRNMQANQMRSTAPTTLRSSADSVISYESSRPSIATHSLAPLQQRSNLEDEDRLTPLLEDDPQSFDLVSAPLETGRKSLTLEARSDLLLSKEHLEAIFRDTASLLRFTSFLSTARPNSVPILVYYLDALKALRAISYANAVAEALEPINELDFTETPARPTLNAVLEEKASQAFEILVRDDLPAFVTHVFIQVVSVSISKRITNDLPEILREASEGLAEVFCLSDPSRQDNPIIFASEEFHRTTQYGVGYAIGRNCRFLQGPRTQRASVARFSKAAREGTEHSEILLNYRRDGSPFMNLLMMAPLLDSRGTLRYFIGAQVDISGLVKDGTDLEAYKRLLEQEEGLIAKDEPKDEFQELSEMFNHVELSTVRKYGGSMHREQLEEKDEVIVRDHKPRLLIQDQSTLDVNRAEKPSPKADGRLSGPYKHYLIVRPAPSLRILFTSPSLRVPGILQSKFLDRIGGSNRVRDQIGNALADPDRGVTAKVRWLSHAVADVEESNEEGRPRWIHCTPLLGQSGSVGVWMVVLVDEKEHGPVRRFRQAPPVASNIRGDQEYYQPPSRMQAGSRIDGSFRGDREDEDVESYSPRQSPSLNNGYSSPQRGRYMTLEALRQPHRQNTVYSNPPTRQDHRGLRSANSSMKGSQASTDSFQI